MKYKLSSTMSIILMLSFLYSSAQTNPLNFTITSNQAHISGQNTSISSTIKKTGSTVTWTQVNNGKTDATTFTVEGISKNTWDTSNSTGAITYRMDTNGYRCDLFIKGTTLNRYATLTFHLSGTEREVYTFYIKNMSYQ